MLKILRPQVSLHLTTSAERLIYAAAPTSIGLCVPQLATPRSLCGQDIPLQIAPVAPLPRLTSTPLRRRASLNPASPPFVTGVQRDLRTAGSTVGILPRSWALRHLITPISKSPTQMRTQNQSVTVLFKLGTDTGNNTFSIAFSNVNAMSAQFFNQFGTSDTPPLNIQNQPSGIRDQLATDRSFTFMSAV